MRQCCVRRVIPPESGIIRKATMAKKKLWRDLSFEQRKEQVRLLREEGLSDEAIGEKLAATKGQIVGFRHRHQPELTGAASGKRKIATRAVTAQESNTKHEGSMLSPAPQEPEEPKISVCQWPIPGRLLKRPDICGKPTEPGERLCTEHKAVVRKMR